MSLVTSFKRIRINIQKYSKRPDNVSFIAVTKNRSIAEIKEILDLGINRIGENRVQEALKKFPFLSVPSYFPVTKLEKHFIGHLQKNKVALAIEHFDWIDSVDSLELARKIDMEAGKKSKKIFILIEVNISEDPRKYGIETENTEKMLRQLETLKNLSVKGLMTIGKKTENREEIRRYYKNFYQLFKNLQNKHIPGVELEILSMGMSDDYKIALEEGSNMIRLGRALFEL
ncbi:YggS family pyridoxal phosphate-dependent enzyme [Candidatus Peregrinibacteria bacterium]|nr:YggS family pyridoxal phosphate-dependent enzyme [Candidatus Peregrinibacteria bacterium]